MRKDQGYGLKLGIGVYEVTPGTRAGVGGPGL